MMTWLRENERLALAIGWVVLASVLIGLAAAATGPGMLYDEAWLAQQGRAFVEPTREGLMPPGTQKTWLFGRPFPLFALPYLGALKSQLLIAPLAVFGNELSTTRFATLAIALAALLATMQVARRVFGLRVALGAGVLLAADPTVFFHAQWEWGPFTTGWLCRALGALLLWNGYRQERVVSILAGGFALGLGVYNRADFLLIGAATVLGLAIFHGPALREIARRRSGELAGASALFLLGALPMFLNAPRVLGTFGELTTRGDFGERVRTLLSTLDGSYAYRLMDAGGRYDALAGVEGAPIALLGAATVVAVVLGGIEIARSGLRSLRDGRGVLGVAVVGIALAMLGLRGATRAHHMLNLVPFVHLLVAAQLFREFDRGGWRRGLAVTASIALVASSAISIGATRGLIERTGGRGWWSDAIDPLARELEAEPGAVAVSFDWGFHLPLLFATSQLPVLEPYWKVSDALMARGQWSLAGTPQHVYLVHDAPYDRFGYGPHLLAAARALGERARIRVHRDREQQPAFYSVRIAQPHQLRIDRSGFHFDL